MNCMYYHEKAMVIIDDDYVRQMYKLNKLYNLAALNTKNMVSSEKKTTWNILKYVNS